MFTMSQDGQERTNVFVKIRATREELQAWRKQAKEDGRPLKKWLADMFWDGLLGHLMNAAEDELLEDKIRGEEHY